jgi:hypothetical protein
MPTVIDLAQQYRDALLKADLASMGRLTGAYQQLYSRLQDKIDLLIAAIDKLDKPTRGQVMRLGRYGDLIREIEKELTRYGVYAQVEISTMAREAISKAVADSAGFMALYGITNRGALPVGAIEAMLGFLKPDGVLFKRLEGLAGFHAQKVADGLLEGIGLGYNPRKVAGMIQDLMGGGLTDALRMARTSNLYAYREATRANYIANDDVVKGWIWWAELDSDVCMSCVAMHGTIHPLDETLDDHHNGRCAMLPYLGDNPADKTGEDWFNAQSEATQREMMGNDKFDAWKEGKFEFGNLSSTHTDDVYGEMRGETPLKDLIGE